MGIEVDFRSLGAGFGAGVLTTLAVQRAWRSLQRFREDDEGALGTTTTGGRLGHRRYSRELIERCQRHHTYGKEMSLTGLLVEPRFIMPPSLEAIEPDADEIDIYADMVLSHDHPYLYAPYHVPTLRVRDLGKGDNFIAILGHRGSGRTTALQAIALYSLGKVNFSAPHDGVMDMIEQELAELDDEKRKKRIEERRKLEELRTMHLAEREGLNKADVEVLQKRAAPALQERSPLFVDAFNLNLRAFVRNATDPAEPLVRAVQQGTSSLTRRTMARAVYKLVTGGHATILIDNLDYLPEGDRKLALQWLRAFVAQYQQNMVIVTYDVEGYHALTRMGFAGVFLRAWHDQTLNDVIRSVAQHWQKLTQSEKKPPEKSIQEAIMRGRAHTPFELLMRLRGIFAHVEDSLGVYTGDYIAQRLGRDEAWSGILGRLGALQLREGVIKTESLTQLDLQHPLPLPGSLKGGRVASVEDASESDVGEKAQVSAERALQRQQRRILGVLEKAGLLVRVRGGYRFLHHALASYCASLSLEDEFAVQMVAGDAWWYEAIAFVAERLPIERAVAYHLQHPSAFTQGHLVKLARWLAYAGESASWRGAYLRQMGNLILAPQQYQATRERLMASLISTRDKGITIILQKAFQSGDNALKKVACLALGVIESSSAISPLTEQLANPDIRVQISAALALSVIRHEEALDIIGEALQVSANEYVRRAIAESLANNRETGYPTLYDAVMAEEMLLRRAAVFGLGRIETDWALITLNETYQRDGEEYYVRSAAELIFITLFRQEKQSVRAYPELGAVPWLMTWGTEQVRAGRIEDDLEAVRVLDFALQSDSETQVKAIKTAGMMGLVENARGLYGGLFSRDKGIRNEAYRTLMKLEMQLGQNLPAPQWA